MAQDGGRGVVTFLVKVSNYTNVQVSLAHGGMWQVPVRDVGPQPRDLINECLREGREVRLVIALERSRQLAGFGRVSDAEVAAPKAGGKTCAFGFEWLGVFRQRGPLLPYSSVASVVRQGVAVTGLPSFSRLSEGEAATLEKALRDAVAAAEELLVRQQQVALQLDDAPLSQEVVARALERIESQCGRVIFACWSGARRYNVSCSAGDDDDPALLVVFVAPLERVLSLRPPLMQVSDAPTFVAWEVGAFCTGLTQGQAKCLEALFVEEALRQDACWAAVRGMAQALVEAAGGGLAESLLDVAAGRSGLKGARSDVARLRDSAPSDVQAVRLHKRLAHVERVLSQVRGLRETPPRLVVRVAGSEREEIMAAFVGDPKERLGRADEAFNTLRQVKEAANKSSGPYATLGEWLLQLRLASAPSPLPPPLSWKGESSLRVLAECPWPLLVMGKRVGPDKTAQILGVFAGNVRQWLASPAGIEAGDRGWGDLCIRSGASGYVLYELGRFAEMLVWGNPFVVELLFLARCRGGQVAHKTPHWEALVAQAESLVTARGIMQVMSAVQAQLKQLIEAGKPFFEDQVALADLLHAMRKLVVAKVGPSDAGDSFNAFQFWREPVEELPKEQEVQQQQQQAECKTDPRDGPACMPSGPGVTVGADFSIDKTALRECLVELDELRPKWIRGVFPEPVQVQKKLDEWLLPIRLACLNK
jgi:hypothetical protein